MEKNNIQKQEGKIATKFVNKVDEAWKNYEDVKALKSKIEKMTTGHNPLINADHPIMNNEGKYRNNFTLFVYFILTQLYSIANQINRLLNRGLLISLNGTIQIL